jgi:hypothetical protein
MFFLGILYRLISFFAVYKVLLAGLSAGVYFYIGVTAGFTGGICSIQVLLAVTAVCKVDI